MRKRRARTVSAEYSFWYPIVDAYPAHDPPELPSWSISGQGAYAISESILWLNRRGAVVARHKAWLINSAGGTYCSF